MVSLGSHTARGTRNTVMSEAMESMESGCEDGGGIQGNGGDEDTLI